jgi:hypothetical protein
MFMFLIQPGEIIMQLLKKLVLNSTNILILTQKPKVLILMVWLKLLALPKQVQLFYYMHVHTIQLELIQQLNNGDN